MAIPETQLDTWSHQGAIVTAQNTHLSVRNALDASTSKVRGMDFDVYLQGSYKNDTNIRGDSDVDVVVELSSAFGYDLSGLPAQQQNFESAYPSNASYLWEDFRRDVLDALRSYYGRDVTEGHKSLKITAGSGRLAADVVPAIEFRKYLSFYWTNNESHASGIRFRDQRDGRIVINFPKLHYQRGVDKNSASQTNGWFKPSVRMIKNLRTFLIDQGVLRGNVAPSYFVEGLVYNVPNVCFGASLQSTCFEILKFLSTAPLSTFRCQNGQLPLFGESPEQWSVTSAKQLISSLITLWNDW